MAERVLPRCQHCSWPRGDLCPGQRSRLSCPGGLPEPIPPEIPQVPTPDGRLRVAFVGDSRHTTGGTETWHDLLAQALDRDRIQVTGWACRTVSEGRQRMSTGEPVGRGVEAIEHLARNCDLLVVWGLAELARYLPPERPRTVAVTHGQVECEYTRQWILGCEPVVDQFVAVSGSCLGSIPESRRPQARVIANGYSPDKTRPGRSRAEMRAGLGIPQDAPVILFNGRLAPDKRPALLLEAAALAQSRPWVVLAGSGVQQSELRGLARERVLFLGHREDTGNLLGVADLLANPSLVEGFGLSMLEAVVAGTPVLASPRGLVLSHPDWFRVVSDESAAGWAGALDAAFTDITGERSRAGLARPRAVELYGPERFGREWTDCLLGLVPTLPPTPVVTPAAEPQPGRSRKPCCGRENRGPMPVRR